MTSTYTKGTRIWLPDPSTGWAAGTVLSVTLPAEPTPTASVTIVVALDSDDSQTRTLTFPFSLLEQAGNDIQPTTAVAGQDSLPPLRNPPLLESSEDLASLSNLNEPSGKSRSIIGGIAHPSTARYFDEICAASSLHLLWYRAGESSRKEAATYADPTGRSEPFQPSVNL